MFTTLTTMNCMHTYHARLPMQKKKVGAHLKVAAQHLDNPVKYWDNIAWSNESKTELNTHHVWRTNGTSTLSQKQHTNSKVWRWQNHGVGQCVCKTLKEKSCVNIHHSLTRHFCPVPQSSWHVFDATCSYAAT